MANIKSQIKRIKTSEKRRLRNKSNKSALKTYISNFEIALEESDKEKAGITLKRAVKEIDKAAAKKIIHLNNAANKKSKLVKKFNTLSVV
ncbi:MAG: 30S ribosomal protein S20 [Actinobacteria bacterium]|nr:30S ribosomal protein S20 [Actinomycetota bacterium]